MMDVNGHYEQRRQNYKSLLREAEEYRLARELGFTETSILRSIAAKLLARLSQIRSPKRTSSDDALIRRTQHGG